MYKGTRGYEKVNRDFLMYESGRTRGHEVKLKRRRCQIHYKKFCFPCRTIDKWNSLNSEMVQARSIHESKDELDKYGYGGMMI